ncbi:MCE family protein [Haloactinomyces albus]|uniref:Virulence factor Mce-like protein n=1 Tax=Haloactinomyces albus TaxID=1352928 RepID=A0AAE3ZEK0_9ACTN|nr:MCE family protein [Haloactinomyces albus]MDR7302445.1 virulence factor Mce-like protein [Haloactinomyces albus]
MSAPRNQGRRVLTTVRRRLMGLALLMCMVLFVSLTVAIYQKAFKPVVDVMLHAESTGNQLRPRSEVKIRGVLVGKVREITTTDGGAKLHLALEPEKVDVIPANVSARLLPKTLFGERYVSLQMPENPAPRSLSEGDVITQDRTRGAIELQTVLADTLDTLEAIQPADLAATLNALSTALDGRGEQLGKTLSQLNTYLEGLNPSVPDLKRNLQELVGVARTYEEAAPDVLRALRNLTTTSRTLVEQREHLDALTKQVTRTSHDIRKFLETNEENLIRLNESARPTLDVLAKYAPEYPCLLRSLTGLVPRLNSAFGAGTKEPGLHITLEITSHRGKYEPNQDEPQYNDERGPRCYDFANAPKPFPQYPPDGPVKDGSSAPPAARTSNGGLNPPANGATDPDPASTSPQSASTGHAAGRALGIVNSPAERDFVSALMAPTMGVPPEKVPGWGSLLVGPLLRGAEVSYR